jgi:hypothetical protein
MNKKGLIYKFEIDKRPNVDISNISYETEGNILQLKMWVEGNIIKDNTTTYGIYFGEHLFIYSNDVILNSSSFTSYEIDSNSIFCTFKLSDEEDISTYNLTGVSTEFREMEDEYKIWVDVLPDLYPPYIFISMGAGRNKIPIGRGIYLKVSNMHDIDSVDCFVEIKFNAIYGEKNSQTNLSFTVSPNSYWKHSVKWRWSPIICNVEISLTISDYTCSISGKSIGQWYFFDNYDGYIPWIQQSEQIMHIKTPILTFLENHPQLFPLLQQIQ